jgi:hypothetical protein
MTTQRRRGERGPDKQPRKKRVGVKPKKTRYHYLIRRKGKTRYSFEKRSSYRGRDGKIYKIYWGCCGYDRLMYYDQDQIKQRFFSKQLAKVEDIRSRRKELEKQLTVAEEKERKYSKESHTLFQIYQLDYFDEGEKESARNEWHDSIDIGIRLRNNVKKIEQQIRDADGELEEILWEAKLYGQNLIDELTRHLPYGHEIRERYGVDDAPDYSYADDPVDFEDN